MKMSGLAVALALAMVASSMAATTDADVETTTSMETSSTAATTAVTTAATTAVTTAATTPKPTTTPEATTTSAATTTASPDWDTWTDWGACSQTCGEGSQTRTRTCLRQDGACGDGGSEEQVCKNDEDCPCSVDPCASATTCNPTDSTSHQCTSKFVGDRQCVALCVCTSGYVWNDTQSQCVDVNECSSPGIGCYADGTTNLLASVSECFNTVGSYKCICNSGYKNPESGDTECVDINECDDDDNNCAKDRATCTNTEGSFTCACDSGYSGNGVICMKENMFDVDYATSHDQEVTSQTAVDYSDFAYLSNVGGGYRVSGGVINSLYATKSGLIVFTDFIEGGTQESFPQPTADKMEVYAESKLASMYSNAVGIAAAYWSKVTFSTESKLYTKFYTTLSADMASNISEAAGFDASWAYVATWIDIPSLSNAGNTVSYQAVIAGNEMHNQLIAMARYKDGGMNWNIVLGANNKFFPIAIGVALIGDTTKSVDYAASVFLNDNPSNLKFSQIQEVDKYDQNGDLDDVEGGRFLYRILDHGDTSHSGYKCNEYLTGSLEQLSTNLTSFWPGLCGTTSQQIGQGDWKRVAIVGDYDCYQPRFLKRFRMLPQCCYTAQGALAGSDLTTAQDLGGANIARYRPTSEEDKEAFLECCSVDGLASGESTAQQCNDFLAQRPASTSASFTPARIGQFRGDPHLTTLDGLSYTFNGHGEFVMVEADDGTFQLQGRTVKALKDGVEQDATIFSGFAAQYFSNGSVIEMSLNGTRDGVDLYVNTVLQSGYNWSETTSFENVEVSQDADGKYVMLFENEVVVKITVSVEMITSSVLMPAYLNGAVKGLLGNSNSDPADDLMSRDGNTIAANSTEADIYPWGLGWMTNENTSLFSYHNGDDWSTFNNASFVPVFFNADLTVMFPNETIRNDSYVVCNGGAVDTSPADRRECYFDYMVTLNSAAAAATVNAAEDLAAVKTELDNFAPVVNNTDLLLQVTVGMNYTNLGPVIATDANEGDTVVYSLLYYPAGLSIDANTGVLTWTSVQYAANESVVISISDGTASSLFSPKIEICNCDNGACQFNAGALTQWTVVGCACTAGWQGAFCSEDTDGCAQDPCFGACTDVPASLVSTQGSEFLCDPCPAGLIGDGTACYDEDECKTQSPCDQNCENTAGSFVCSCNDGYALSADGRNCNDVDECLLQQDKCDSDASCTNTVGSYTCACDTGYTGDGADGTCLNINECATADICPANSNCVDTDGSYECACIFGYKESLGECVNVDECALGHECAQDCVDGIGTYSCECVANFVLNTTDLVSCDPEVSCNAAERAACDSGNLRSTCGKAGADVLCICPNGYSKDANSNCQDIDECVTGDNICSAATSDCKNENGTYSCVCKTGYELSSDGRTCEDKDECEMDTDGCAQECTNIAGSFVCSCDSKSSLNADGKTCDDIDECASSLTNMCDELNGNCTNQDASTSYPLGYECRCSSGYELSADQFTCIDINECQLDNRGDCAQGCANSIGGYSCFCGNGFSLNGDEKTCDDIDECAQSNLHNCQSDALCNNTVGGYTCACPSGFVLKSDGFTCESIEKCVITTCEYSCSRVNGTDSCGCPRGKKIVNTTKCVDIDECASNDLNVCDVNNNVECVNSDPGYSCQCVSDEYQQLEATKCVDKDECADGSFTCPTNSYCINTDPGYMCECDAGYTSDGAGGCKDLDECSSSALNECNDLATCANTEGAYTCTCNTGYEGDGVSCFDVNECATGADNCDPRTERGTCVNSVGSFSCECYDGFTARVSAEGVFCDDIDECATPDAYNLTCSQKCVNLPGSATCGCNDGYTINIDGRSCDPINACNETNTCEQSCLRINGTDTCQCNEGYNVSGTQCLDIDECAMGTDSCAAVRGVCTNTVGRFTCSCTDGYILGSNNECDDRDGGLGEWTAYSNCSANCGLDGTQTRTRQCDNPTPAGSGLTCAASDLTDTQSCNVKLCDEDLTNGVSIRIEGITKAEFDQILSLFATSSLGGINGYCSYNVSTGERCCGASGPIVDPTGRDFLAESDLAVSSWPLDNATGVIVVLTASYNATTNDFCELNSTIGKRAAVQISQDVLLEILSDPVLLEQIDKELEAAALTVLSLNLKLTLSDVGTPVQLTSAAPSTTTVTTPATTTTPSISTTEGVTAAPGVKDWVIAVAVVGALVGVAIIVIIIIVVLKKNKTKVGDGETAEAQGQGSN